MKYGLLIYKDNDEHINIGDYVQSLAAEQFLPAVDTYLNRENLNNYSGPKVKLIMNGWFLHEPKNWPPSSDIDPLFISFHLNLKSQKILNDPKTIEHFKKHEPIGCRDKLTASIIKEKGIQTYFSSCLTTTLGKSYSYDGKREGVYFVDPPLNYKKDPVSILKYFFRLIINFKTVKAITKKRYGKTKFKDLIKTTAFYLQYSKIFDKNLLKNATYITHRIHKDKLPSEDERFNKAKDLIKNYAKAKFVVTTRIHCALPSIGLNTPVIYIDKINKSKSSAGRLDGLMQYFNVIQYEDGELNKPSFSNSEKISFKSKIKNNVNINSINSELISKCKIFVENSSV